MSALAARRAAAAAAASTPPNAASSPAPARRSATSKAGRSRQTKATRPDVQSANVNDETAADHNGRPAVSMVDDAPGPSKRPRTGQSGPQRYLGPLNAAVSDIKGKGKGTRKRAFSPSAPMMSSEDEDECKEDGKGGGSDEDQDVGSDTDDPDQEADQLDEAVTPYGTPGAWRPRSTENIAAVSRFVPRKGHNFELLSSGKLDTLGVKGQGNGMLLSLAAEEDIYLAGTFSITPIQGRVSFYGTILSPTTDDRAYPVYSPVSHAVSAISFSDTSSSTTSQLLSQIRLPDTLSLSGRALILVRGTATGLDGMRGGAIPGFATAWGDEKGWMGVKGVHSIPGSIIAPCYPYQQPETWTDALDQIYRDATDYPVQTAPIVLVKGPKRSGKSTIARTALNTLLQTYERVAWLECDLGQGEFGCGGVIGLWVLDTPVYGPAFTHPRIPRRAHFLGTYTPLTCPDEYIAAIQHLLDVYRYELQDRALTAGGQSTLRRTDATPLVINTQGWVKGLGEELLRSIEGATRATHVLAFDKSPSDGDDMERNGWTSSPTLGMTDLPPSYLGEEPRVFSLDQAPVTPLQQRYTAADYRNLSTLAYLHANLASNGEPTWDFTSPMLAMPPFEVAISPEGPVRSVYMQGEGAEGISIADLPLALNGALVALVDNQSEASLAADTATYVQGRPLPPLDSVNYLGLAVIRAVVPAETGAISAHKIHVLAPLPADVLTRCNAIIRNGAMELPTAAMLDWRDTAVYSEEGLAGVPWADVPFFDTDTRGVGIEKRKIRRNLMRKGM